MLREYIDLKYKPDLSDLICLFRVEPAKGFSIKKAAEHIASESSVGTWTDVPRTRRELEAKVFATNGKWIKVAYPVELFEPGNMPQILSSIAGNIFGMKSATNLRLEDVQWPEKLMRSFKGPLHGISGVRKILNVFDRPLTGTIIKPKLGLNEKEHAGIAYQAWLGGIDIVKDDENLSNLSFNKFEKRVVETLKARDKAEKETGERKMYMPNITAETNEMLRRARFVKEQGGEYAMIDIITVGWSSLQTLRDTNEDLRLILHAHRAGHAAFTRNPRHGISMLVIADIARLIGVDQLHIGALAKMIATTKEVIAVGEEIERGFLTEGSHILAEDWRYIKPVFAVCSGGIHPGLVPKLIHLLGKDIIIQSGGGVHGNPLGTKAGASAMRQVVDATMKGISLEECAKSHKELKAALDKWGL